MTELAPLSRLSTDKTVQSFISFIREAQDGHRFADFFAIDLMAASGFLPYVFVIDFRNGMDGGIKVHFSGRKIAEYFGRNIQGRILEEVYNGRDGIDFVRTMYRRCFEDGKICLRRKPVVYDDRIYGMRDMMQNFILFPCSSDGEYVNFAIGMAIFSEGDGPREDVLEYV